MNKDIQKWFNFTANALMPVHGGNGVDEYLRDHFFAINTTAQRLMKKINYKPVPLYRGIVLKEPVEVVEPHSNLMFLSFTDDINVARHFADPINGFGTEILDIKKRLGTHGYVIEYTPRLDEVLFHYKLFDHLPYADAFSSLGMNGKDEVAHLRKQHEIMILQPPRDPFTNITKIH